MRDAGGKSSGRCWGCRRVLPLVVLAQAAGRAEAGLCLRCAVQERPLRAFARAMQRRARTTGRPLALRSPRGYHLDSLAEVLVEYPALGTSPAPPTPRIA
ncbi:MAG TPA: hypothetical protein VFW96_03075 [Thermomicrobiales bacterium]|nr:hypothetical protein [Thermomicrobiales bacterium]